MTIHLTIRDLRDVICETDITDESTISDLKAVISEFYKAKAVSDLILIFHGEILEDERTLVSYGIKDGSTLYVSAKHTHNYADKDEIEKPNLPKPNTSSDSFTSLMQSSIGKSIMNMIQNNPQAYADMLRSNPIFSQIAENNPQLQHILNDSDMLSEQIGMYLNPENQNQTARTMDRMLDAVESMPGGFQALSKQINDLQEPLMDGLMDQIKGSGKTKTNIDSKPLSKPSEEPIPFQNPQQQGFGPFSFFNSNSQSLQWPMNDSAVGGNDNAIPREAVDLINKGALICLSKGLQVEKLPGFSELIELCCPHVKKGMTNILQVYSTQLKMMNEMGFKDNEENIRALIQTNGEVSQAIDYLLAQMQFQY